MLNLNSGYILLYPSQIKKEQLEPLDNSVLLKIAGLTTADKLYNMWIRLQNLVNIVFDSDMDKVMTDKYPGVRQVRA